MKLGLALAGGGMRGIAHAGVITALEENNIEIDVLAGTSSGSLVAILNAMGFTGTEIYDLFNKYAYNLVGNNTEDIIFNSLLFDKGIKFDGLRSGKPIEDLYNQISIEKGYKYIKDIKKVVGVVSTDVIKEKECIFSSIIPKKSDYINDIEIGKAVRASSSFSVVFDPCLYKDKVLLDGGILNNVPVDVAKKLGADKVIAVNFSNDKITEKSNIIDIGMKTVDIMGNRISKINLELSDILITVDTDGTSLLDINNIEFCFKSGYRKAIEYMDEIKKLTSYNSHLK